MPSTQSNRIFALVQRELQEYKNSLVWTPLVIASALVLVMLLSVVLADRIAVMGDAMLQVVLQEESASSMNITIQIDDNIEDEETREYRVERQAGPVDEDEWNFSREWTFNPTTGSNLHVESESHVDNLNPMLNMLHNFLLVILVLVSANYLLGSLFNDRKDRSILFWKSMPVSEWEEVLSKLAVALLVAPAVFIAVSILLQLACALLAMLLVWRLDMDPYQLVLGNINFVPLFLNQIGGWLLTVLWVAPAYAWLMLASAGARRSPVMLAIAPVLALIVVESVFLGTQHVSAAVFNHVPHHVDGGRSVGFYFLGGPDWSSLDFIGMALGLLFAAVALWLTVYLRRYRFET